MPLQLHGTPELANFAAKGARMRVQQSRDLHGERASARDDFPGTEILPGGAQDRGRVYAGVIPEPAIFVLDQRLKITGRDLFDRHRIAPDPVAIGKTPERRALLIHHHPGRVNLFQRQRPQAIGDENQPP